MHQLCEDACVTRGAQSARVSLDLHPIDSAWESLFRVVLAWSGRGGLALSYSVLGTGLGCGNLTSPITGGHV